MIDTSAFSEGCSARIDDDENGTMTDNPHTPGTNAFECWYQGYNFKEQYLSTSQVSQVQNIQPK